MFADANDKVRQTRHRSHARSLINKGIEVIQNQPTAEKLRPIVDGLIALLPSTDDDVINILKRSGGQG